MDQFSVNVVGVAKTIAAFLPLLKKSEVKKVITISTGLADLGTSFIASLGNSILIITSQT